MPAAPQRRLVVVRHAKAERLTAGERDAERRLDDRGRRDAAALPAWLAARGLEPDLVVTSPSRRTVETCQAAGLVHRTDARVYDASAERLLEVVAGTDDDVVTLVLVGHEPGVSGLAAALADAADPLRAAVLAGLPTCAVAVLRIPGGWSELVGGSAALEAVDAVR